jgi:hypothetical protein
MFVMCVLEYGYKLNRKQETKKKKIPMKVRFGAHPASYAMCTGSFPGVKRPGRGVDHSPPSSAEVKERVVLYLYSHSGPSKPVLGADFTFFYHAVKTQNLTIFACITYLAIIIFCVSNASLNMIDKGRNM